MKKNINDVYKEIVKLSKEVRHIDNSKDIEDIKK